MGNSIGQYAFQQPEPLNNVVVASDNAQAPNNGNADNNAGNVHNNNRNGMARHGNPDNLFGTLRNDLASYFPFGRLAPPPPIHHTSSVKSLVNLHKDSVVVLRDEADVEENGDNNKQLDSSSNPSYRLLFKFDALDDCDITILVGNALRNDNDGESDPFELTEDKEKALVQVGPIHCAAGTGQTFKHPKDQPIILNPPSQDQTSLNDHSLPTDTDSSKQASTLYQYQYQHQFPLTIRLDASGGNAQTYNHSISNDKVGDKADKDTSNKLPIHSQTTYCILLACGDGTYVPKIVQQKIHYQGKTYVVHDIFGLDHTGERESEGTRECVVCMSEPRDTTVLPCRHLCVCAACADLMRMQTNKCPICRAPVTSLLNITLSKESCVANNGQIPIQNEVQLESRKENQSITGEDKVTTDIRNTDNHNISLS